MAEDIVQTVKLEGADQTAAGYDKVAAAANAALKSIASGVEPTNAQLASVGAHVENLTRNFVKAAGNVGSATNKFVSNIGRMASTVTKFAAAAGLGVAALKKISAANKDQAEETKIALAQNRLQSKGYLEAQQRSAQYERSVRDLNASFASGKLTMAQYADQFNELTRARQEDEDAARQQELAQSAADEERIRNEAAIKREAAATKAHAEAVDAYGSEVASALQQLSPAWDNFLKKWNTGPSIIADIMRAIANVMNQSGDLIIGTLNRIADKLGALFSGQQGGDRVQAFQAAIMTAFNAIAGAVENVLIPALQGVVFLFNQIASVVNAVFGTKLSGGVLAVAAAFVVWSGALKVVTTSIFAVIEGLKLLGFIAKALAASQLFTPWGIAIAAIVVAIALLITYWDDLKAAVVSAVDAVQAKLKQWSDDWAASVQQFKDAWASVEQWFTDLWESIKKIAFDAWEGLKQTANDALTSIGEYIKSLFEPFDTLIGWIKQAVDWFKELIGVQSRAASQGAQGEAAGMKRGGQINGRGSSTSDSIPIWASRGEWVIRAQAAQYYGRRFMSMVNSMRLPRDFNLAALTDGAMLGVPMARFATGGEVGAQQGSRVLNLTLPGLGSFNGLTGPDETMERLQMAAVRSQLRSAGRPPGWYGGR